MSDTGGHQESFGETALRDELDATRNQLRRTFLLNSYLFARLSRRERRRFLEMSLDDLWARMIPPR